MEEDWTAAPRSGNFFAESANTEKPGRMPTSAATQQPNLTPKQMAFVDEYLIDLNASAAARRAGYSERTAHRTGLENLQKPGIAAAIQKAKVARSKRTLVDADRTLLEYARIGFFDIRRLFDEDGRILAVQDLPDDVAHVVKKVKVRLEPSRDDDNPPAILVEVDLCDKMTALAKLADHVGMTNKQADAVDNLADALRNHARALPVAKSRPLPIAQVQQREDIEDAVIVDGEVQP